MQTQSGLTINVIDLVNPVPKGDELTYKIIVSNKGTLWNETYAWWRPFPAEWSWSGEVPGNGRSPGISSASIRWPRSTRAKNASIKWWSELWRLEQLTFRRVDQ